MSKIHLNKNYMLTSIFLVMIPTVIIGGMFGISVGNESLVERILLQIPAYTLMSYALEKFWYE